MSLIRRLVYMAGAAGIAALLYWSVTLVLRAPGEWESFVLMAIGVILACALSLHLEATGRWRRLEKRR